MSLLSEYEQRTAWKYEPIRGSFHTAQGLAKKVDPDGNYQPFPGTTVVFRPESICSQTVAMMQRVLYHRLEGSGMLASALPVSTIHMTLHDLVSPEKCISDPMDPGAYHREMAESLGRAADITEKIQSDFAGQKITMVADRIVNMVSKSLVLLLKPQTEQDYERLLQMYRQFNDIVELPYPLTPHITLAYFRPGMLDGDRLGEAVEFAQINPECTPVFDFYPEGLTAQRFLDMQHYLDDPMRICFCCDGGMNRSVMAAQILNHMAAERKLPIVGEARAAFPDTEGEPIPAEVWRTLEEHGIKTVRENSTAVYLDTSQVPRFSRFAVISEGARDRVSMLGLPREQFEQESSFFYGVRDPQYREVTHEQAFQDICGRMTRFLDSYEEAMREV